MQNKDKYIITVFKSRYEEPWVDEEWKSFGGARKGLTCSGVSLN